jgi:hypothetical protein
VPVPIKGALLAELARKPILGRLADGEPVAVAPVSGTRLDVGLGEDIETQTWRHFALTPVETNDERFIRAIRQ